MTHSNLLAVAVLLATLVGPMLGQGASGQAIYLETWPFPVPALRLYAMYWAPISANRDVLLTDLSVQMPVGQTATINAYIDVPGALPTPPWFCNGVTAFVTPGSYTLLGSAAVAGAGPGVSIPLGLSASVMIPQGQSRVLYIHSSNGPVIHGARNAFACGTLAASDGFVAYYADSASTGTTPFNAGWVHSVGINTTFAGRIHYTPQVPCGSPASLWLSMGQPAGPGTIQIRNDCGNPGSLYITTLSFDALNSINPGAGWWSGLHVTLPEVIYQLSAGLPPFMGMLDAGGSSVFSIPAGVVSVPLAPLHGVSHESSGVASGVLVPSNVFSVTLL